MTVTARPVRGLDRNAARSGDRASQRRLAYWLIAPAVILMLAVTAYPIIYAFWLSLHRYNLASPNDTAFIGFANYQTILTDNYWWTAFFVTLIITVISVTIEFVLGLALALVMHRTIFGKGLVRTAILIPYGIVTVAASYSWYYAWTPGTGYLANLLPDGSAPLTQQIPSLAVIIGAEVWKTTPFMALLLLAALQLLPRDCYEAARVDGIHPLQVFVRVTLPLIRPALMVAVIFRLLDALRMFDLVYVLTPNAAETAMMSTFARQQLVDFQQVGYGSAATTVMFFIIALLTVSYITLGRVRPGAAP